MNTIHVLARAVIIQNDHILVCHTQDMEPNYYFLPGGHVENGESAAATVLRELKEEGGIEGTVQRFLGCFEHSFDPQRGKCHSHEYNLYFEVKTKPFDLQTEIPQLESHIKLLWMPIANLERIDFRPPSLKDLLLFWLRQSLDKAFASHMID